MAVLKKCRGLITFPNEVFKPEGALEIADNVVIDANDIIEPRRGFSDYGLEFGAAQDRLKQILEYKGRILRHYNSTLEFDSTGDGSFSAFSGTYDEVESGLRMKSLETQSNFYFTTDDGFDQEYGFSLKVKDSDSDERFSSESMIAIKSLASPSLFDVKVRDLCFHDGIESAIHPTTNQSFPLFSLTFSDSSLIDF